jgi:hypothetical protein
VQDAGIMPNDDKKQCQVVCDWLGGDRCEIDSGSWWDGCIEWYDTRDCAQRFDCDSNYWYQSTNVCAAVYASGLYFCQCTGAQDKAPCWYGLWWKMCLAKKA